MKRIAVLLTSVLLAVMTGCDRPPRQTQTSTNPEVPITGAEVWSLNGTNWNVEGTALLIMGNGSSLVVIKALVDFPPNQNHRPLAMSLARHAIDNGYHTKVRSATHNGRRVPFSGSVGVALVNRHSMGINSGWRYNFTVDELKQGTGEPEN